MHRLGYLSLTLIVVLSPLGCILAGVWLDSPRIKITPTEPLVLNKSIPFEIEVKSKDADLDAYVALILSPLDVGTIEQSEFTIALEKNDKETLTTNITFVETGLYQVVALFVINDEQYYSEVTIEMSETEGRIIKEGDKLKIAPELIPVTIEVIP